MAKTLSIFFIILSSVVLSQNIIYVDSAATGLNNGTTWSNAFTSLQPALQTATPGYSIFISKGTYYPTKNSSDQIPTPGAIRTVAFKMRPNVKIFGGFNTSMNIINFNQRNPQLHKACLSGDIGIPLQNNDNAFSVIINPYNSLTPQSLLDGVVIKDGYFENSGSNFSPVGGGGLLNLGASPSINSCTFTNNYAVDSIGSTVAAAGAIATAGTSTPVITNCVFINNSARAVSSVYAVTSCGAIYGSVSSINSCTFTGNKCYSIYTGSLSSGATSGDSFSVGAFFTFGTGGHINSCLFSGNTSSAICTSTLNSNNLPLARSAGAINHQKVKSSVFDNNSSYVFAKGTKTSAGAIFGSLGCSDSIFNCNFSGNSSICSYTIPYGSSKSAGAILFDGTSSPNCFGLIKNCNFISNSSNGDGSSSGAIMNFQQHILLANSTFSDNSSFNGIENCGALLNIGSSFTINASSFKMNKVLNSLSTNVAYNAGAIFIASSGFADFAINNCVIESNSVTTTSNYDCFSAPILNVGSQAEYNNVLIRNNFTSCITSYSNGSTSSVGGGIFEKQYNSASHAMNNISAYNNMANAGGSIANCSGGILNSAQCEIYNTLLTNNLGSTTANSGTVLCAGGLLNMTAQGHIQNCTVFNNNANCQGTSTLTSSGGILNYFLYTPAGLFNNIIWGNNTNTITGTYNNNFLNFYFTGPVTYNDIQGGYPGAGNINLNPLFNDTLGHICFSSPARNAGTINALVTNFDLDQNPRIIGNIDMGAYEVQLGNNGLSGVSNKTICLGSPPILTGTSSFINWYQTNNFSNFITENDTLYTGLITSGTYSFYANDSTTNCTRTPLVPVVLNIINLPTISISSSNPIVCPFVLVTLTASGANTYTWNTSSIGSSIAVSQFTTTIYSVTGKNAIGCSNTSSYTQSVSICSSLNDNQTNSQFQIYPNPNDGKFYLKSHLNPVEYEFELFDCAGRKISDFEIINNELKINNRIEDGLYILKIFKEQDVFFNKLIIKK